MIKKLDIGQIRTPYAKDQVKVINNPLRQRCSELNSSLSANGIHKLHIRM
jgi:hypothetical protein